MAVKGKWRYWWPTLTWAGIIFLLSSRPTTPASEIYWLDFIVKKSAHVIEYAVLGYLLLRSLKETFDFSRQSLVVVTFCLVLLYAVTDEFHQSFVPGRGPSFRDVIIDAGGAMVGIWLANKRIKS